MAQSSLCRLFNVSGIMTNFSDACNIAFLTQVSSTYPSSRQQSSEGENEETCSMHMSQGLGLLIHVYCPAKEAGFYSDVVDCFPVHLATWVRFPAGTGEIFCSTTSAPTVNNPPYDRSVHKYPPSSHFT